LEHGGGRLKIRLEQKNKPQRIMMKLKSRALKSLGALAASFLLAAPASAEIVYDNSDPANYLDRFYAPGNNIEFGDQVTLAGTERLVTEFQFEYYWSSLSGNETAQIFFYANNAPGDPAAPLTELFRSGEIAGLSTDEHGFGKVVVSGMGIPVPDTFTWTVILGGIDGGEQAGLTLYSAPTVGDGFADFWMRTDGTWATHLLEDGAVPAHFGARITAIPEPGTYALMAIAAFAFVGYRRLQRRVD
jgi:hypothetical protein